MKDRNIKTEKEALAILKKSIVSKDAVREAKRIDPNCRIFVTPRLKEDRDEFDVITLAGNLTLDDIDYICRRYDKGYDHDDCTEDAVYIIMQGDPENAVTEGRAIELTDLEEVINV